MELYLFVQLVMNVLADRLGNVDEVRHGVLHDLHRDFADDDHEGLDHDHHDLGVVVSAHAVHVVHVARELVLLLLLQLLELFQLQHSRFRFDHLERIFLVFWLS